MNLETELNASLRANTEAKAERPSNKAVYAEITSITDLKPYENERLYHIFSKYYDGHSKEQFLQNLFEKDHIILLRDKQHKSVQGFSTLLKVELPTPSGSAWGIFSGDTILEKAYWGNPALGKAFLKYLWREKIKHPFSPLYWFLISKGYKTYLLMANNFATHYPRHEQPTPERILNLMKDFYGNKYKTEFNPSKLWITPSKHGCRLKESIANITDSDRKNARIAFFEDSNPSWKEGCELACIAEMNLLMPIKYSLKKTFKAIVKLFGKK